MKKNNLVVGGIMLSILIFSLLILNLVVAEPASKGVAGGIPSGTTPTALPQQLSSCSNPQQCREIDEVWRTIGPAVRNSADVWDFLEKVWVAFSVLYPTSVQPAQYVPAVGTESSYDIYIREAHNLNPSVDELLVKAIMKHESNFQPQLISSTGCVGLLQICTTSAKYPHITKMATQPIDKNTDLSLIHGCCTDETGEEVPCQNERIRCGSNIWCPTGGYRCSPSDDDRFEPRRNILSGTETIKNKMTYIGDCGNDRVKAWIVSYNLGEKYVKNAINNLNGRCDDWKAVWQKIVENSNYSENTIYGDKKRYNVQEKLGRLDGEGDGDYLAKIFTTYQQYYQEGTVVAVASEE